MTFAYIGGNYLSQERSDEVDRMRARGIFDPIISSLTYDAVRVLHQTGETEPEAIRQRLYADDFHGITGPITFDHNGRRLTGRKVK